ncbi:UNVERIFIED_CONTAM: hypothetical protein Slati_2976900 [Sesamum latifolium]|uniref:Uncharacterized protein n=1 Tax=Sesamum latifolium TaxID=2727402 RepID=A0AAW2VJV8_9LAMI
MTQRKWLDLIKDYDLTINYHPGKEDRVVDALSRKTSQTLVIMTRQLEALELEVVQLTAVILMAHTPIDERIKTPKDSDTELEIIMEKVKRG